MSIVASGPPYQSIVLQRLSDIYDQKVQEILAGPFPVEAYEDEIREKCFSPEMEEILMEMLHSKLEAAQTPPT